MRTLPLARVFRRTSWIPALLVVLSASGAGRAANLCVPQIGPPNNFPFDVTTPRLKVTVNNGEIVGLVNLASGSTHASATTAQLSMPSGVGHITDDVTQAGGYHSYAASVDLPTQTANCPSCSYPPHERSFYHHPYSGSNLTLTSTETSCTATWSGLSNGGPLYFPYESLTVNFQIGAAGELMFKASASSTTEGVFDVVVPIVNLASNHRIYLPYFGGVMFEDSGYDGSDPDTVPDPLLRTFNTAPQWEAPVVALETSTGSLGLWIEDATLKPNMFMFSWTGWTTSTFGVGIPQFNRIASDAAHPYPYTSMTGTWWRLDGFTGNWTSAMAPYKSWYATTFATELGRRQTPAWADKVRVILDEYIRPCEEPTSCPPGSSCNCNSQCADGETTDGAACDDASYSYLKSLLGPTPSSFDDRVMLYESDARCWQFDSNLPAYDVNCARYPSRNTKLQTQSFRTMGYVSSYFVNFGSDAFHASCAQGFALPRKYIHGISDLYAEVGAPRAYDSDGRCLMNPTQACTDFIGLDPTCPGTGDNQVCRGGRLSHTFTDACKPCQQHAPNVCCPATAPNCNPGDSCCTTMACNPNLTPPLGANCGSHPLPAEERQCDCSAGAPWTFGELLATDPLSASWRNFHIDQMVNPDHNPALPDRGWRARNGFDAVYEDGAYISGDSGNGCIDGLCGAQGSVKMFQDMQTQSIGTDGSTTFPMASEQGNDATAFAMRWTLRDGYKYEGLGSWLMTRQRPVSSYLFDNRAWVPSTSVPSNEQRLRIVATSDASGGVAQASGRRQDYRSVRGDVGHALYRAQLFSRRGIRPTFETRLGPSTLTALYTDDSAKRYEYHVGTNPTSALKEQRLVECTAAPVGALECVGTPLYSRLTGASTRTASDGLRVLGWPALTSTLTTGLNPATSYNFQRYDLSGTLASSLATEIKITSTLPSGVRVSKYYETPKHILLVLDRPSGGNGSVTIARKTGLPAFTRTYLNEVSSSNPSTGGTSYAISSFPARFLFIKSDLTTIPTMVNNVSVDPVATGGDVGRFIEKASGLSRGDEPRMWHIVSGPGAIPGQTSFTPLTSGDAPGTVDFLVKIPSGVQSTGGTILVQTCDTSTGGDGSIGRMFINGLETVPDVRAADPGATCIGRLTSLTADATVLAGKEVVISVQWDAGTANDGNADNRLFSRPRLIPGIPD